MSLVKSSDIHIATERFQKNKTEFWRKLAVKEKIMVLYFKDFIQLFQIIHLCLPTNILKIFFTWLCFTIKVSFEAQHNSKQHSSEKHLSAVY